jgi:RNA polymerase sigma-70 factor (ECF subfamily)
MTAAVESLVATPGYRGELTAFCRRILGSSVDAEDAVQETLLRAWRASERFEGRASLQSWMHRIAINVCFDALSHAARRPLPVEDLPEPVGPGAGGEPDPSELAVSRERLRLAITAAVCSLPTRQRAVLLLRDVLSWRASEVAELLGTTTAGVNSTLQRAHATLAALDPEGVADATENEQLVARYLAAFADDDIDSLVSLAREP